MQFPQALASSQYGPIWSKTTVAQCDLGPISSNRTIAHDLLDKFYLFNKSHLFWLTGQLRMQFLTGFSFLTIRANLKQNDSCAVWLGQILSNSGVAHGVLVKFKLYIKCRPFQGKRQLCRAFGRTFWATGQFRTVFFTSFSFLSKDTNFN